MTKSNPLLDALDTLIPAKDEKEPVATKADQLEGDDLYTIKVNADQLDCILNSFNAQKIRIKANITDAKKRKATKEVSEWQKLQKKADAVAAYIRSQTGRIAPNK